MQAIHILKLDEPKVWPPKDGRASFSTQQAECIVLTEEGAPDQVGVLRVPRELVGKLQPGLYQGTYVLGREWKSKEIAPLLVNLTPIQPKAPPASNKPAGA